MIDNCVVCTQRGRCDVMVQQSAAECLVPSNNKLCQSNSVCFVFVGEKGLCVKYLTRFYFGKFISSSPHNCTAILKGTCLSKWKSPPFKFIIFCFLKKNGYNSHEKSALLINHHVHTLC